MSKQYVFTASLKSVHPVDVFALAAPGDCLVSGSGSSSLKVHSLDKSEVASGIAESDSQKTHEILAGAHPLGCHHICAVPGGSRFASVGFGGELIVWQYSDETKMWKNWGTVKSRGKAGEIWAIAISGDGRYLASTSFNSRVIVWDLINHGEKAREYQTKGSFGMSVDISLDGSLTASGHENGKIFIYNNESSRIIHSLTGLLKPVRAVSFSPGSSILAAAGDSRTIALFKTNSGEQIANLSGHTGWITSLAWNSAGTLLLSGSFDGKVKVWSIETSSCVTTQSESENTVWAVCWLSDNGKVRRGERFAFTGASKTISVYRDARGA